MSYLTQYKFINNPVIWEKYYSGFTLQLSVKFLIPIVSFRGSVEILELDIIVRSCGMLEL